MSDAFDPYHKWLAIPPEEQPPNHYRLLGVSAFEQDSDVIDAAANQRMAWLQDMAAGPHVDLSQKLLNEISAARRCLLNPATKAEYDAGLRRQREAAAQAAAAQSATAAGQGSAVPEQSLFGDGFPAIQIDVPAAPAKTAKAAKSRVPKGDPAESEAADEDQTPTKKFSPLMLAAFGSVSLVTMIIACVMIIGGGESAEDARMGMLEVKWALGEREGAYVQVDDRVWYDASDKDKKKMPEQEKLLFKVKPGSHRFLFERAGYRQIAYTFKFTEGEREGIELRWRPL